MGVENGEGFQEPLRLDQGEVIPNRVMVEGESKIAPTELESRFGREGVIVAVFIARALRCRQSGQYLRLVDVAKETGYKDLSVQYVEKVLLKHGFRSSVRPSEPWKNTKQKLQNKGRSVIIDSHKTYDIDEKPLSKWIVANGIAEDEIQRLVQEYISNHNCKVVESGVDVGMHEPLRLETLEGGQTELESRFGREGVIVATFIDLGLDRPQGIDAIDIAMGTGIEDIYAKEVVRVLTKYNFDKAAGNGSYVLKGKPLNKWMLAQGVEEKEIQKLVAEHLFNRKGRVDFGLGERSPFVDDVEEGKYLNVGVVEPKKDEGDSQAGFWV